MPTTAMIKLSELQAIRKAMAAWLHVRPDLPGEFDRLYARGPKASKTSRRLRDAAEAAREAFSAALAKVSP